MSRALFSFRRPQLEALEDRLAPGSLLGTSPLHAITPGGSEDLDLAFLVGLPFSPQNGVVTTRPVVDLEDRLAPGSLLGASPPHAITSGDSQNPDLAFFVGLALSPQSAPQSAVVTTTSPVVDFATRSIVYGESTLTRTDEGITAHLMASGLAPGAYTFWTRVDAPGMGPVSGWLAGHVVGEDGILNFSAHVSAGEILSGNPDIPSGPLQDPLHAKITLVVRSHGPVDPGRIYEQTHTYEPGVAFNFLISIHAPPP